MAKLQEMGEFVRSASSTIEAPVVRRLKEAFATQGPKQAQARKGDGQVATANGPGPQGGRDGRAAPVPGRSGLPRPSAPKPAAPQPAPSPRAAADGASAAPAAAAPAS